MGGSVPVLVALVVIRIGVKVLQVAFRRRRFRPVERSISWMVWLAMVLGDGPAALVLQEMEQITRKVGGSMLSLRTIIEGTLTAGRGAVAVAWISAAIEARLLRSAVGGSCRCARRQQCQRAHC